MRMTGGCQCGRVRYAAEVDGPDAYLCHCRMCQRAASGVSIAFVNLPKAKVSWEIEPDYYRSSPIAHRPFCSTCGTPLGFAFPDSEKMDLTVGSFDQSDYFVPTQNFGVEGRLSRWKDTAHLPSIRADEWEPTTSRWLRTTDSIPSTAEPDRTG